MRLWRSLLRKSLPPTALAHCRCAVFGLGDSGYPKFNVMAKKLDRRLEALGAQKLVPLGLGDDQARLSWVRGRLENTAQLTRCVTTATAQHPLGYEAALGSWAPTLWAALRSACPLPPGAPPDPPPDAAPPPPRVRVHVTVLPDRSAGPIPGDVAHGEFHPIEVAACMAAARQLRAALGGGALPGAEMQPAAGDGLRRFSRDAPFLASVAVNARLTVTDDAHPREVRHLEFSLAPGGPQHMPGDALAVAPLAPPDAVAALLQRLCIPVDAVLACRVEDSHGGSSIDREFTVAARHLVRGWLDVSGAPPRRSLFAMLAATASAAHEAQRLAHFGSAVGRDDAARYSARERRSLLEVLADFPSAQPPLGLLLQAAPRLHARLFSISSSADAHPGTAHVTAAVVAWSTPLGRIRRGVLTSQLAELPGGSPDVVLPVWTVPGSLRLPADPSAPVLMVGPGTGVAPFRAFVQQQQRGGGPPRPMALFFGCRHQGVDELYGDEFRAATAPGQPLCGPDGGYFAAYSRDEAGSGGGKRYVTHLLVEQGALVWQMLSQGGHVYVAGAAGAMPRDVLDALAQVVLYHAPGMGSAADAEAWVRQLELQRRCHIEVWG